MLLIAQPGRLNHHMTAFREKNLQHAVSWSEAFSCCPLLVDGRPCTICLIIGRHVPEAHLNAPPHGSDDLLGQIFQLLPSQDFCYYFDVWELLLCFTIFISSFSHIFRRFIRH